MRFFEIIIAAMAISPLTAFAVTTFNGDLGTAGSFAVLGASTVTNTGDTTLFGDLGVYAGTSITGFPPGTFTGTEYDGDATAMNAQADALTAYNSAAAATCGTDLTGQDLGGLTLTPGVYCFDSSAALDGTLTLDNTGDPNAIFLFQIGSTLITGSNAAVDFADLAQGGEVFWQVGSSATLGTGTEFAGSILADASITLTTGADITCGRAVALTAAVTLDTNSVDTGSCSPGGGGTAVSEPSSASLLFLIGLPALLVRKFAFVRA